MSGMEFDRRKRPAAGLNMTPLIDMVFLLLIFFVLSSHFISEQGFKIKLPKAVRAQAQKNENIVVFVRSDGSIIVEGETISTDTLERKLARCLERSVSKTVVIKADEDVNLKLAVKIMDIAKAANAGGLVISTQVGDNEIIK
ncbi:MAG: biopolymer transporter ExbD [Candidatus Omnitrophica bacterium]|nr:biopolymer transporter ExbD [Candidatus Omnitrophota bacterium]